MPILNTVRNNFLPRSEIWTLEPEGLPPSVVVGAGHPPDSPHAPRVARSQDLTPTPRREWDPLYGGIPGANAIRFDNDLVSDPGPDARGLPRA